MLARNASLLIAAGVVLAACASELDRARTTAPMGDAFSRALSTGYLQLAENEEARKKQSNANRLARRAISSAKGKPPAPDNGAWTGRRASKQAELDAARKRLVDILAATATKKVPETAAVAQTAYDCWLMQSANGARGELAGCRNRFESAMDVIAAAQGDDAAGPAPVARMISTKPVVSAGDPGQEIAPPPVKHVDQPALGAPKQKYVIYFEYDSAVITPEAEDVIGDILAEVLANDYQQMRIEGHADRAGPALYNLSLSERRAQAVDRALKSAASRVAKRSHKGFGERRPAKATPDGIREVLNRRTEVLLY